MATGNGHSPLSEAMAVMGVLTMTKASFVSTERHIGEWWWELLQESMQAAGEEERNMAIANNSFHQNVPAITVILDGEWSKRTHRHNYNAKSGVGIIIGKTTGKILLWAYVINSAPFVQEQTIQALPFQTISVSRTGKLFF